MNMEETLIVSEAIKKSSRNKMIKYLDKMFGSTFYLRKYEKFMLEPVNIKDVYSFIADHYRDKPEDSYTG